MRGSSGQKRVTRGDPACDLPAGEASVEEYNAALPCSMGVELPEGSPHRLQSARSTIELERRMAPGTGVGGNGASWMKVLCTMWSSFPSFHGESTGHEVASVVTTVVASASVSSAGGHEKSSICRGEALKGHGVEPYVRPPPRSSPASSRRRGSPGQKPDASSAAHDDATSSSVDEGTTRPVRQDGCGADVEANQASRRYLQIQGRSMANTTPDAGAVLLHHGVTVPL